MATPISASDDATVTFTDVLPDISITKTADPISVPETGGNVTFSILIRNNSWENATIDQFYDSDFDLSLHCFGWLGLVLSQDATYACIFIEWVEGDYGGPDHVNTATVVASDGDGNSDTASDDATVTFTDVLPDITVLKTGDPVAVPETGGLVEFTFRVTNNSLEAAAITALTDDKFGILTGDADCKVGTVLAGGAYCAFDATFGIPAGDFPGTHVNVFTATVTDGDGNDDTDRSETITYTDILPDITALKTGDPLAVPETGGDVEFTYRVTYNSLEAATITALSDDQFGTLTGDLDCMVGIVLAAGASCAFEATFAIPAGDVFGSHVNVFTATVTDGDGNTDTATDSETITYTDVLPDITVPKTAGVVSIPETGGNVLFTYVVTNHSAEAAEITALSDDQFGTLAGDADCKVGTVLAGGASCSFEATFAIPAGDVPGTHVNVFTATVTDGDGNNDTATDSETVTYTDVLPDISVLKTVAPTSVPETGGNVVFTFRVTNNGPEVATISSLSDSVYGILTATRIARSGLRLQLVQAVSSRYPPRAGTLRCCPPQYIHWEATTTTVTKILPLTTPLSPSPMSRPP